MLAVRLSWLAPACQLVECNEGNILLVNFCDNGPGQQNVDLAPDLENPAILLIIIALHHSMHYTQVATQYYRWSISMNVLKASFAHINTIYDVSVKSLLV